ncbi:MAG: helix-turn-helix domain-containing protein [Phycisphaeraceae bacterium]
METDRTPLPPRLLTYKEAGAYLGLTDRTIWQLVHEGHLTAVRIGGSVRIDPADLKDFIQRNKNRQGGTRHG